MARPIYLALLNGLEPPWTDALRHGIARAFDSRVELVPLTLDFSALYAPERNQFHATLLLAHLLRHLPASDGKILGVTGVDLFIPVLTFVFGQAQLDGPGAVVSTHRLVDSFYGLPPDEGRTAARTLKEAVHELGHAHGLVHCPDYACVMHASTSVEEVDLKQERFCRACRAQLPG